MEVQVDRVVGQAFGAVAAGHLAAHLRADHAVDIADRQVGSRPVRRVRGPACTGPAAPCGPAFFPVRDPARSGSGGRRRRGTSGLVQQGRKVDVLWLSSDRSPCVGSSLSVRPIISSTVRKPSLAIISRISWAMKYIKLTTCCGSPVKFLRSSGFWVATPAGQVSRWQTRIMTQPSATSGAVAKPNSSAPSRRR